MEASTNLVKPPDTFEKALQINLDSRPYGVLAEIGAGQEVSRWFFRVGGAAGTIAKSVSAYDMKMSDTRYGDAERYVSRERLIDMLDYEYSNCADALAPDRGERTTFFAFADTVAAASYRGTRECHGWLGIRFQAEPNTASNQILLHVRMLDADNLHQQEALGIVGVNLVYGAFQYAAQPERLLRSLLDGLSVSRIEVDMVDFTGPTFEAVDNRVMSLRLVHYGLTPTTLFDSKGAVLQPSEVLYKMPVLVQPGQFRPPTWICAELQINALARFRQQTAVSDAPVVSILSMTMSDLESDGDVDLGDFLDRVDVLAEREFTVLISNYVEYFRLAEYVARYTSEPIGIALGVRSLERIFNESYYRDLGGGVLEALGRLFQDQVKLLVYPTKDANAELITADNLNLGSALDDVLRYLRASSRVEPIETYEADHLAIRPEDVLGRIQIGDPSWEQFVPPRVAAIIKEKKLFGLPS